MKWILLIVPLLAACGSSPYLDSKFVWQHDRGSDWVLQPERPWVCGNKASCESETRLHITAGLEWNNRLDCPYVETILMGPWDQMLVGCSKRFGTYNGKRTWNLFIEPAIVHQVDGRTSEFLRTDQTQWQGHNPFVHLRAGVEGGGMRCPVVATGKSLFQGAPFEREEGEPDLYWVNLECGVRFWGKTGAWQQ
jgi:hypothetical protein